MPVDAQSALCPKGARAGLALASTTAASAPAAPAATRRRGLLAVAGPPAVAPGLRVIDGDGRRAVTVTGVETMCNGGTVLFLDAVPLPCEFVEVKTDAELAEGSFPGGRLVGVESGAGGSRGGAAALAVAAVAAAVGFM
jgi:hypothetical protein